jgi:hypothetical protein
VCKPHNSNKQRRTYDGVAAFSDILTNRCKTTTKPTMVKQVIIDGSCGVRFDGYHRLITRFAPKALIFPAINSH